MTTAAAPVPRAYWRQPAVLLTLLVGLAFVAIGLEAIAAPSRMSAGFGLPMASASETAFVQVYGSRTVLLAAFVLVLLAHRRLRTLALLLTGAAPLPLFDMWVIWQRSGVVPVLYRHAGYLVLLVVLAGLLWRASGRLEGAGAR